MSRYDIVLKNGLIFDGSRVPRYRGDIAIRDGVIAAIGRIDEADAARVLDAEGLHVAPGFIDLHTHYDAQLFWDPYCTLSGWHGVTSVVIGNCGFGFAPVAPEMRERAMMSMTRVEAIPFASMKQGMPWDWVSFPEYLDSVERAPKAMNILPYVPVAPLLISVLGFDDAKAGRMPTEAEHAELCRLFEEALEAGAHGWSAQRLLPDGPSAVQLDYDGTPMVTDVMHDATCEALAGVLGKRNQGFMQMTISSGSIEHDRGHMERLATLSGRPLLWNVVQAYDHKPEVHRAGLKWLASCRERGIRVYGQGVTTDAGFAFTFEDWNLWDDRPAWREATLGSVEERLAKLADPARRPSLRGQVPLTVTGPIKDIVVTGPCTAETERWKDHTIGQVAEALGKHPVDAMLDIAVADGLRTEFFAAPPNVSLENLKDIIDDPYVLFGVSDGGAHTKFFTAGRYPTETLCKLVREHNMLSLEEAHWRLSALPATLAGFENRGVLRPGAPADIVVYDYEALSVLPSEIVHDLPGGEWRRVQRARGYRYILVNGAVTIENDRETNVFSGRLLRHGSGATADTSARAA
ncbi:MAG: amidohydrolase family protein [Alphaproteobacteria bacterium]|nr:amidohydrolase family protein [Alphaproteobacteria bacterium]